MNTIIIKNGITVITPNQDLTASNAESFKSEILKNIHNVATPMIELDLSKVKMVDSVGLGVVMATDIAITKSGKTLIISVVSDDVYSLMKTMRLDRMLEIKKAVEI